MRVGLGIGYESWVKSGLGVWWELSWEKFGVELGGWIGVNRSKFRLGFWGKERDERCERVGSFESGLRGEVGTGIFLFRLKNKSFNISPSNYIKMRSIWNFKFLSNWIVIIVLLIMLQCYILR